MAVTTYGDIGPEVAGYVTKNDVIRHNQPKAIIDQFGVGVELPKNETKTIVFEGFDKLDPTPNAMTEGVQPSGKKMVPIRVTKTLVQYGDLVTISDVVKDTVKCPVLKRATRLCGSQFTTMMEIIKFGVIKAGTNVVYANGTSRAEVIEPFSRTLQDRALRSLRRQDAETITEVLSPSPDFNTVPIPECFAAMVHTDAIPDIERTEGFVGVEKYSSYKPLRGEFGKLGNVRYCASTIFKPWEGAGGTTGDMLSSSGGKADVYPVIYVGTYAYGHVALRGENVFHPMVLQPGVPRSNDRLGQVGSVGWKTMQGAVILNDMFMVRGEIAVRK